MCLLEKDSTLWESIEINLKNKGFEYPGVDKNPRIFSPDGVLVEPWITTSYPYCKNADIPYVFMLGVVKNETNLFLKIKLKFKIYI